MARALLIIDPHAKFNGWPLPAIGMGRDMNACATALLAVGTEFDRRMQPGEPVEPRLTVFIDEYPALAAERPQVAAVFKKLLREAAKTHIRLVVLTQDANVKTLGVEGEEPARDNVMKLVLGSLAVKLAPATAGEQRPAALDYRGSVQAVSVAGLPLLADRFVTPNAVGGAGVACPRST